MTTPAKSVLGRDVTSDSLRDRIADLQAHGWTILFQVLSPVAISSQAPALRAHVRSKQEGWDPGSVAIGANPSDTVFRIDDAPQDVVSFVTSPVLGRIAATLLEVPTVRLLHYGGFFKAPGGPGTPWHQDLSFLPLNTETVLTLWIPLSDVEADMGVLRYADGSHTGGQLAGRRALAAYPFVPMPPLRIGDLSAHLGWTAHSSLPNNSERYRDAMTICYYADGARVARRDVTFAERMIDTYFAGLQPDDLAMGPSNPVVFPPPTGELRR